MSKSIFKTVLFLSFLVSFFMEASTIKSIDSENFSFKYKIVDYNSSDKIDVYVDFVIDVKKSLYPDTHLVCNYFLEYLDSDGFCLNRSFLGTLRGMFCWNNATKPSVG